MEKLPSYASQKVYHLQGRSVDFHEDVSRDSQRAHKYLPLCDWAKAGLCRFRIRHAASL